MPIAPQAGICRHHEHGSFFITLLNKITPLSLRNPP